MTKECDLSLDELYAQLTDVLEKFQNLVSSVNPEMLNMFQASMAEILSIAKATQMALNSGGQIDPVKLYNEISPIFTDPSVFSNYQEKKRKIRKVNVVGLKYIRADAIIKALKSDVMRYDTTTRVQEVEDVRDDRIIPFLSSKVDWNDAIKEEMAKLKRHLIIEQDIILIDRTMFGPYAIEHMGQFSMDDKKAIFELETTLDLINKDMVAQNPKLKAIVNKYRPQSKDPNDFALGLKIKKILKSSDVTDLITDRQKYTDQWLDKFVDDLLASEKGKSIIVDWSNSRKRNKIPALVAGPLVKAGVFGCSNPELARAISKCHDIKIKINSYATYLGKTEEMPYLDWVLDYVKSH